MPIVNSPTNTYERFIEFEEGAGEIYLHLASRFASEDGELSAFWLGMAMEEKQHSVLLQFCLNEKWFAPSLPGEDEVRKYTAILQDLGRKCEDRYITKDEAFAMAAELEGSEINAIYCRLTNPLNVSPYLLKKKIVTSPFDHIGHLAAAGKQFKVSGETLKKLERLQESCVRVSV